MKKNYFYALLGAIALTGAVGFSSCSSTEDTADVNPNFNPETNEVTTDFVFNVSTSNTPTTRMSSANTQAQLSDPFRGIGSSHLFAYKQASNGKAVTTALTAPKTYDLGTVLTAGQITQSPSAAQETSHRVLELAIPTETNTLMFWGKAIKDGTDKAQGKITFDASNADISKHTFSLQPIITAADQTKFNQFEALFVAALNKIVQTEYHADANTVSFEDDNGVTTRNADALNVKWSDFVNVTGTTLTPKTTSPADNTKPLSPLGEILAGAFVNFNTIAAGEIRAGSGPAIQHMLVDLYQVINKVANSKPTSYYEQVAKNVGAAILANIALFCDGTSFVATTTFESNSGVSDYSEVASASLTDFPRIAFGTPEGGTQLQVAISSSAPVATWSYVANVPTSSFGGGASGTTSVFNYMFPAELCYFGNSPIRTTTDSHSAAEYPEGVANWDNDASWAAGQTGTGSVAWEKNSRVQASTRSVAMQNNINYGTALLKTTVKYGTGTLKDNNHAIQYAKNNNLTAEQEPDATIDVTKAGQFTLTGVLVGGQTQHMGWNYVAKALTGDPIAYNKIIYDADLPSTAIPAPASATAEGAASTPNYTLVWDNWNEEAKNSDQNKVYIALEFQNNTGKAFWGLHNLIPADGVFYIIGELDPDVTSNAKLTDLSTDAAGYKADKSLGITWPANYALPPYGDVSTENPYGTIKKRRVFIQDYMTEANFKITENSLKHAYVTVPDLRSTQISLGLSVDLQWQTGLVFDDILLGGE